MKLILEGRLIAYMKCFDIKNAKKNYNVFKNGIFYSFLDIFRNGTLHRAEVLSIVISVSKRFIYAVKQPSRMMLIVCHIMGGVLFSDHW